jgi:hypothetical protein
MPCHQIVGRVDTQRLIIHASGAKKAHPNRPLTGKGHLTARFNHFLGWSENSVEMGWLTFEDLRGTIF